MIASTARWLDDRLATSRFARSALNKVFPDHWSFMIGEVAMYCFVILIITGTFLSFFFTPSAKDVIYQGSYLPLRGVTMSEAYQSTVGLSFDVRAGLVIRQIHHWAALLFLVTIACHVARIFFTGAFRRPREINWLVGVGLLLMALFNGFTGYSLPDDLLSGTGLRIAYSIALSVPFVGDWLAFLVFGGEFPASDILSRLFVIHILLVPAVIAGLLGAHLTVVWRQKHTQFPGRGRRETNVVGSRLWPTYTARSIGLFAFVFAVLGGLAGLAQINPVWLYGPFEPAAVSTAAQPDWYLGWVEGALRIFPAIRLSLFGYRIPEALFSSVLLPTVAVGVLVAWPFLEQWRTKDRAEHHLLDRPRDRPVRTGIGIAAVVFVAVMTIAGGQDLIAQALRVPISSVVWALRVLVLALPPAAGLMAWKVCRDLAAAAPLDAIPEGTPPPAADPETHSPEAPAPRPQPEPPEPDPEPADRPTGVVASNRAKGPAKAHGARAMAMAGGTGVVAVAAFLAGRRYSKDSR
ncbi:MAG: cytochrome bc1 complex cytochrome b subunit [Acidimicrobiales bacterium]